MYYVLVDCAQYGTVVHRLRELCGEQWEQTREQIVHLHEQYGDPMRNLAYERLLVAYDLSDAAWRYIDARQDLDKVDWMIYEDLEPQLPGMILSVGPTAAHKHRWQVAMRIMSILSDEDSSLFRVTRRYETPQTGPLPQHYSDTLIIRLFQLLKTVGDKSQIDETMRMVLDRYPERYYLRGELCRYY